MDREISDIYVTNNYDLFSLLETNRTIKKNKKLELSILEKGILRPIAVNSLMQVIDGQHRYSIARKYNLPLPYYVTMNKEMDDIIEINNTVHRWGLKDYINKYVEEGNIEYINLQKIMNRQAKIANADLISSAMGSWTKRTKLVTEAKKGNFKFYNYEAFLKVVQDYEMFLKYTQIKEFGSVFQAYFEISSVKKFNQEWFINKINELEIDKKILGIKKTDRILKAFLETYNHNLQNESRENNRILWSLDLKHNVIIDEELKNERLNNQ